MGSPSNRQPHARRHSITNVALSVALCTSGVVAARPAEVAFVTSTSTAHRPSLAHPSVSQRASRHFLQTASCRIVPIAMSTDDKNEKEGELPVSGSFFNEVPPKDESSDGDNDKPVEIESEITSSATAEISGSDMELFEEILKKTTISRSGSGQGFSKLTPTTDHAAPSIIQTTGSDEKESFVGIGKPLNDVQNPEYDENGYTLYADETTGEKKRVFEALVEYPSVFKMKIVGKDEPVGSFAPEIVETVAKSCGVDITMVKHTERKNGKWTSVTVHAPVKSADMLYSLYENVDKDPRVKFKF